MEKSVIVEISLSFFEKQPGEPNIGSHEKHSGLKGDVKTQVIAIATIRDHFQV